MKAHAAHSHGWLVGILGLAVGITLMVGLPKLQAVAGVVLLVAWFHLVGIAVVLGSVYSVAPFLGALAALRLGDWPSGTTPESTRIRTARMRIMVTSMSENGAHDA